MDEPSEETLVVSEKDSSSGPPVEAPSLTRSPPENDESVDSSSTEGQYLASGMSTMISTLIKEFDSKAQDALKSQEGLDSSLDRLIRELDQLLENAPLPFIVQHAARISSVKRRVSSMNAVLKSVQRRVDNIDHMLTACAEHGIVNTSH